MNKQDLIEKIIAVLTKLQEDGHFDKVPLAPDSCPIDDLPQFDSQIWVTAVTIIGSELGLPIPLNENIFRSEDGENCLTVEQVTDRISTLIAKGERSNER